RHQIGALPQRELEVHSVLFGQRRGGDGHVRQRDSLVVGDLTAVGHHAADIRSGDLEYLDGDPTVVDEQPVAGADLLRQPRVGAGDPGTRTRNVLTSDDDAVTGVPLDRACFEPAQADLRSLEVGEDADWPVRLLRRLAYPVDAPLVLVVVSVAEVQPSDVHARRHELTDAVKAVDGRPEGTDDLRATLHDSSLVVRRCQPFGRPGSSRMPACQTCAQTVVCRQWCPDMLANKEILDAYGRRAAAGVQDLLFVAIALCRAGDGRRRRAGRAADAGEEASHDRLARTDVGVPRLRPYGHGSARRSVRATPHLRDGDPAREGERDGPVTERRATRVGHADLALEATRPGVDDAVRGGAATTRRAALRRDRHDVRRSQSSEGGAYLVPVGGVRAQPRVGEAETGRGADDGKRAAARARCAQDLVREATRRR